MWPLSSTFRSLIQVGIYALGFLAPWDHWLHLDGNQNVWLLLASLLGLTGWFAFSAATKMLLALAIAFTLTAAVLRSLASALPKSLSARNPYERGLRIAAEEFYRLLRYPKALGTMLTALSLSILMPPSGACLCLALTLLWQLVSIRSEAASTVRLGDRDYGLQKQPLPSLPSGTVHGEVLVWRWGSALIAEVFTWGVSASFLILGWRYNALLIVQGVIVSLGVALICHAFIPRGAPATLVS